MRRGWILAAVAGLCAAGMGCKKAKTPDRETLVVTGSNASSQVLKNFQMQDILNGTKNMVVEATEGRLSDDERVADLDLPHVTFYRQGEAFSVLNAPQGRVRMDTHEIQAWGGVTVVTTDSTTLKTDRLRYDPEKGSLLSDDPVRLEKTDSVTIGTGLDALPDLSRVRIGHQKVYVKKRQG